MRRTLVEGAAQVGAFLRQEVPDVGNCELGLAHGGAGIAERIGQQGDGLAVHLVRRGPDVLDDRVDALAVVGDDGAGVVEGGLGW
jgi:hypothetical protein